MSGLDSHVFLTLSLLRNRFIRPCHAQVPLLVCLGLIIILAERLTVVIVDSPQQLREIGSQPARYLSSMDRRASSLATMGFYGSAAD